MPPRRLADLHTHSSASDGSFAPAEVVRLADRSGLAAVALTDHDTTAGLDEAARAAAELPELVFVPGIEISAAFSPGTMHILGLGIDPAAPDLSRMLHTLQTARETRNPRILDKLTAMGMPLTMADVQAAADRLATPEAGGDVQATAADPHRILGRVHIALRCSPKATSATWTKRLRSSSVAAVPHTLTRSV